MGRTKKNNFWAIKGIDRIFTSWSETVEFKKGTSHIARGFVNREDAEAHVKGTWAKQEDCINIWTDGATPDNGAEDAYGGYAIVYGDKDPRNKAFELTANDGEKVTNNVCEAMAVIAALESLLVNGISAEEKVVIHSDSKYVLDYIYSDHRSGYTKNKVILDKLDILTKKFNNITYKKVVGHGGNGGNTCADKLATDAAKECKKRSLETTKTDTDIKTKCIENASPIDTASKPPLKKIRAEVLLEDD
jgi:ribonuclease HI